MHAFRAWTVKEVGGAVTITFNVHPALAKVSRRVQQLLLNHIECLLGVDTPTKPTQTVVVAGVARAVRDKDAAHAKLLIKDRMACRQYRSALLLLRVFRKMVPHRQWRGPHDELELLQRYAQEMARDGVPTRRLPVVPPPPDEDPDNVLRSARDLLLKAHGEYFRRHNTGQPVDTGAVLEHLKEKEKAKTAAANVYPSWALNGCTLLFSGLIPMSMDPHTHPLWKKARAIGAGCVDQVLPSVTHVVARDPSTEKCRRAGAIEDVVIVTEAWLLDTLENKQRMNEADYNFPAGAYDITFQGGLLLENDVADDDSDDDEVQLLDTPPPPEHEVVELDSPDSPDPPLLPSTRRLSQSRPHLRSAPSSFSASGDAPAAAVRQRGSVVTTMPWRRPLEIRFPAGFHEDCGVDRGCNSTEAGIQAARMASVPPRSGKQPAVEPRGSDSGPNPDARTPILPLVSHWDDDSEEEGAAPRAVQYEEDLAPPPSSHRGASTAAPSGKRRHEGAPPALSKHTASLPFEEGHEIAVLPDQFDPDTLQRGMRLLVREPEYGVAAWAMVVELSQRNVRLVWDDDDYVPRQYIRPELPDLIEGVWVGAGAPPTKLKRASIAKKANSSIVPMPTPMTPNAPGSALVSPLTPTYTFLDGRWQFVDGSPSKNPSPAAKKSSPLKDTGKKKKKKRSKKKRLGSKASDVEEAASSPRSPLLPTPPTSPPPLPPPQAAPPLGSVARDGQWHAPIHGDVFHEGESLLGTDCAPPPGSVFRDGQWVLPPACPAMLTQLHAMVQPGHAGPGDPSHGIANGGNGPSVNDLPGAGGAGLSYGPGSVQGWPPHGVPWQHVGGPMVAGGSLAGSGGGMLNDLLAEAERTTPAEPKAPGAELYRLLLQAEQQPTAAVPRKCAPETPVDDFDYGSDDNETVRLEDIRNTVTAQYDAVASAASSAGPRRRTKATRVRLTDTTALDAAIAAISKPSNSSDFAARQFDVAEVPLMSAHETTPVVSEKDLLTQTLRVRVDLQIMKRVHRDIKGKDGCNLDAIAMESGAFLMFPDTLSAPRGFSPPVNSSIVSVVGTQAACNRARDLMVQLINRSRPNMKMVGTKLLPPPTGVPKTDLVICSPDDLDVEYALWDGTFAKSKIKAAALGARPLPPGWAAELDPRGQRYYYNRTLGLTQWEHPSDVTNLCLTAVVPLPAMPPMPKKAEATHSKPQIVSQLVSSPGFTAPTYMAADWKGRIPDGSLVEVCNMGNVRSDLNGAIGRIRLYDPDAARYHVLHGNTTYMMKPEHVRRCSGQLPMPTPAGLRAAPVPPHSTSSPTPPQLPPQTYDKPAKTDACRWELGEHASEGCWLHRTRKCPYFHRDQVAELQKKLGASPSSMAEGGAAVSAADVGGRVDVDAYGTGTLRFYGMHKIKHELRCGVQLDRPTGLNNGTVSGHTYFRCGTNYGILVPPQKVKFARARGDRTPETMASDSGSGAESGLVACDPQMLALERKREEILAELARDQVATASRRRQCTPNRPGSGSGFAAVATTAVAMETTAVEAATAAHETSAPKDGDEDSDGNMVVQLGVEFVLENPNGVAIADWNQNNTAWISRTMITPMGDGIVTDAAPAHDLAMEDRIAEFDRLREQERDAKRRRVGCGSPASLSAASRSVPLCTLPVDGDEDAEGNMVVQFGDGELTLENADGIVIADWQPVTETWARRTPTISMEVAGGGQL